ncbi:hypothetical protein [Microbacterium sp. cf332]|uniref:hypothetical protein n=1 Tax=Microbacterium sp. cf332 TaxID=1761804 RepID=UPI0008892FAF|nr:hypothetical protein [Microbacterium sp. cf332]SDQ48645.1 hypothetical protein SAMN04487847_1586 [Microbacterium sp. cf332]
MPHEEAPTSRVTSTEPGPRWITTATAAVWGLTIIFLRLSTFWLGPSLLICLVIVGGLIHRRRERFRDDRRFRTSRADDAPA